MRLKPTESKSVSRDRLLRLRRSWKRGAKRVVFTNGVYDILHAGHIQLLETARRLGDILVVGVNSDASARRLGKSGPPRPLNSLKDRMRVLAALAAVDCVVSFYSRSLNVLVRALKGDV